MSEFSDVPSDGSGTGDKVGPWRRFLARVVDGFVLLIPILVLTVPISGGFAVGQVPDGTSVAKQFVGTLVGTALAYAYFVLMESKTGSTVGKKALGFEVRGAGGGNPTVEEAVKRHAWMFLSIIPGILGGLVSLAVFIAIAVSISADPRGRGHHDRFAGTTAISSR